MTESFQALSEFTGEIYRRPPAAVDPSYERMRYQYATTSLPAAHMSPAAILCPRSDADIVAAIRYARAHGVAIALRSGGHAMGGTSSTFGANVQLDMAHFNDFVYDAPNNQVTISAGMRNGEVNARLREICKDGDPNNHPFFPHGHCAGVGMGGHLHTGGYTLFERAFGMFIDHVARFRIILADCEACSIRWIHRPDRLAPDPDNDELWFSVLGGSPGNFGIVTHVTANLLWDKDYPEARGYRGIYFYRDLRRLSLDTGKGRVLHEHFLRKFAKLNDDDDLARDFCVSVIVAGASGGGWRGTMCSEDHWSDLWHDLKTQNLMDQFPHPEMVIVDGMWCNSSGNPADYDAKVKAFFADLQEIPPECESLRVTTLFDPRQPTPVSVMWDNYTYMGDREFKMPFFRRNYGGVANDLQQRDFAGFVARSVEELLGPPNRGVSLVSCFQLHGGRFSQAVVNAEHNPAALGNRRLARSHCVLDGFYATRDLLGNPWPQPYVLLADWFGQVQAAMVGTPDAKFSPLDRRYMYDPFDDSLTKGQVNLDALHVSTTAQTCTTGCWPASARSIRTTCSPRTCFALVPAANTRRWRSQLPWRIDPANPPGACWRS